MARPSRLPRRVHLGRGYHLTVVFVSQTVLRELADIENDELLDGYWDSKLGTTNDHRIIAVKRGNVIDRDDPVVI